MNGRVFAVLFVVACSTVSVYAQSAPAANAGSTTAPQTAAIAPDNPSEADGTAAPVAYVPAKAAAPPTTLKIAATHYIKYPSLNPVTAIHVYLTDAGVAGVMRDQLKTNPAWNCAMPQLYKVAVVDKSVPPKVLRVLSINTVQLIGADPVAHAPYTRCDAFGHPGELDIILDTQPKVGDLVQVSLYADVAQTNLLIASDGTLAMTATNIPTFSATPQGAPGEALNNGTTRTVGQLAIAFADPVLAPRSPISLYAKSTDLLSTDGKDTKSAVAVTLGAQRGLLPRWYSPVDLEQTLQGNQTAKNVATVTSLGFNTLPPWHWASSIFDNAFINAPLPPEPSIANLYTHRFEQLVTPKTPMLAVNDYSVNGVFSWDTISFPFTCKLLVWEKPAEKTAVNGTGVTASPDSAATAVTTPASLPAPASTNCLGLEIDLGGWYLPLDHTTRGTQKAEGYGDISILIPLSDFSVASNELLYVTQTDPTKFQIRIKYSDTVNAANNYARTKGWTFGIEALK